MFYILFPNNDVNAEQIYEYAKYYFYDKFGRLEKTQDSKYAENAKYSYVGNTSLIKSVEYKNYNDSQASTSNVNKLHTVEQAEYTDRGNLKCVSHNSVWNSGKNNFSQTGYKYYDYDHLNRLISEQDTLYGTERYYYYNTSGRLHIISGNGYTDTFNYDKQGRLTSITDASDIRSTGTN